MNENRIGQYVLRRLADRNRQPGRWHRVQSFINDNAITKCGRQMAPTTYTKYWSNRYGRYVESSIPDELEYRTVPYDRDGYFPDQNNVCQRCR